MEEELFTKHINSGCFQRGIDQGKWYIHEIKWPFVIIKIKAKPLINSPDYYYFRFDLNGYSNQAPTVCPWDINSQQKLLPKLWPKGTNNVSKVFNPSWRDDALYAPCDRIAIERHDSWKEQFPHLYWKSDFTIIIYIEFIFKLLNSIDYVGQ